MQWEFKRSLIHFFALAYSLLGKKQSNLVARKSRWGYDQVYKDMINRSQLSKVLYKASCWDCQDFYIGKTKRRLHDRKTEHFKGIRSTCHASAIADHVTSTGHNLKWDHFEILAEGRSDTHCKIKETLLIQELKPTLNDTVSSEKLYLYYFTFFF